MPSSNCLHPIAFSPPPVFAPEATQPHKGGMAAISEKLGHMPMVMHNRQWSPDSDYIRNLSFTWQVGPQWAIATDCY